MKSRIKHVIVASAIGLACLEPTNSFAIRAEAVQEGLNSLKGYDSAIEYLDCLERDIAPKTTGVIYFYTQCGCDSACRKILNDTELIYKIKTTKKELEDAKHKLSIGE